MKRSEIRAWLDAEVRRRNLAALPDIGPPLRNPRHEHYVRCIIGCMYAKDAYLSAGYSPRAASVKGNAGKLRRRPDVEKRIEAILRYQAERLIIGG